MSENESETKSSTDQGRRIGSWGVPGGAIPVLNEDIPDDLEADAVYWYGRYRELEKSYMDLGQQLEHYKYEQRSQSFFQKISSEHQSRKDIIRGRNLVGLFFSTLTVLGAASHFGSVQLPPYLIATAAFAFTAIFDAVSLPEFVGKYLNKVSFGN